MTSPTLAPEAVNGLQAATERLNQHATRLAATGDPIADLVADSAAMTQAGLRMIVDASLTLQAQMRALQEATQQPMQSEDLSKAVTRGIRDCSIEAVRALNVRNVLIGAGMLTVAVLGGGVGGYLFHGSLRVLAGVQAGAQQCTDQPNGGRTCWISIWQRLPAEK